MLRHFLLEHFLLFVQCLLLPCQFCLSFLLSLLLCLCCFLLCFLPGLLGFLLCLLSIFFGLDRCLLVCLRCCSGLSITTLCFLVGDSTAADASFSASVLFGVWWRRTSAMGSSPNFCQPLRCWFGLPNSRIGRAWLLFLRRDKVQRCWTRGRNISLSGHFHEEHELCCAWPVCP